MARKQVKIIGYPLGHSVSPAMQNKAFEKLGLDYEYSPLEVPPEKLEETIEKLRNDQNVVGFNVTVPHKEAIIPFLDEIDESAKLIGAVNTVVNKNGKLIGHNTDGRGFIQSLKEDAGFDPKGKKVVVLGAGGASRAVTRMLALNGISFLVLKDIEKDKAFALKEELNIPKIIVNPSDLQEHIDNADLLVNATPIGMHPKTDQSPLPENTKLHPNLLVYDLVYNPAKTKLMKAAAKSCSGLGMLVHQGALAFELWTGQKPDIEVMHKAAKKALH